MKSNNLINSPQSMPNLVVCKKRIAKSSTKLQWVKKYTIMAAAQYNHYASSQNSARYWCILGGDATTLATCNYTTNYNPIDINKPIFYQRQPDALVFSCSDIKQKQPGYLKEARFTLCQLLKDQGWVQVQLLFN